MNKLSKEKKIILFLVIVFAIGIGVSIRLVNLEEMNLLKTYILTKNKIERELSTIKNSNEVSRTYNKLKDKPKMGFANIHLGIFANPINLVYKDDKKNDTMKIGINSYNLFDARLFLTNKNNVIVTKNKDYIFESHTTLEEFLDKVGMLEMGKKIIPYEVLGEDTKYTTFKSIVNNEKSIGLNSTKREQVGKEILELIDVKKIESSILENNEDEKILEHIINLEDELKVDIYMETYSNSMENITKMLNSNDVAQYVVIKKFDRLSEKMKNIQTIKNGVITLKEKDNFLYSFQFTGEYEDGGIEKVLKYTFEFKDTKNIFNKFEIGFEIDNEEVEFKFENDLYSKDYVNVIMSIDDLYYNLIWDYNETSNNIMIFFNDIQPITFTLVAKNDSLIFSYEGTVKIFGMLRELEDSIIMPSNKKYKYRLDDIEKLNKIESYGY